MQNNNQTNPTSSPFSQPASQTSSQFFTNASQVSQVSETNPFASDLKGEFTSNFGTNTNAVSQIFKDGGFSQNNTKKWIIAALVAVVCILAVVFLLRSNSNEASFEDEFAEDTTTGTTEEEAPVADVTENTEVAPVEEVATEPAPTEQVEQQTQVTSEPSYATRTGSPTVELLSLPEGSRWDYDETMGPISFAWSGQPGGSIIFSRNPNMRPAIMKVPVSGNSYEFYNPYPGTWYWKVESSSGYSEVRSFTVNPPVRRNVALRLPQAGGTLAANGGEISWTEDAKVAFYRVEFSSSGNWSSPEYKFATSGTRYSTQNLNPGQYQLRIGAFSEVAGRWEYTTPISVSVQ